MKSLFFSLMLLLFVSNLAMAQEKKSEMSFSIEDCVSMFNPSKIESTKVGYQFWFVNKEFLDGRTLKMSVVAPYKATHPPHCHTEDEFFFVLVGTAELILNGETTIVQPYSSFYCPPNTEHGIRNAGDTTLKYLVIKKYALPDTKQ